MYYKKSILAVAISLLGFGAMSQTSKLVTHQSMYWMRYYNQLILNEKWTWHNEIDERKIVENNLQLQLIMHTRLHYKIFKNIEVAAGFTYSRLSVQDTTSESLIIVPELRPVQEIIFNEPITDRFSIQHRLRFDERFIHKTTGKTELADGYDFNMRFRYRIQASYKLNKTEKTNFTTLKISDEIMFNAGNKILYNQFDQNRIYLAVEQGIVKNLSAELGYLYLYQQKKTGYQFNEADIVRLTIYHKIKI